MKPQCAVLYAGALQPDAWQLRVPPLCLPIGRRTLLDCWLDLLVNEMDCDDVRILVNDDNAHAHIARALLESNDGQAWADVARVIPDRTPCRGTAGLLRDATSDLGDGRGYLVAVEAHSMPPASLKPILAAMETGAPDAIVGMSADREPGGVYAIRSDARKQIRDVGYIDMKEQLVPSLYREGRTIRSVVVSDRMDRIVDLPSYQRALRTGLRGRTDASAATVLGEARVIGASVVRSGAVVEDGALVQDSVVLEGAVVGRGAVISRSVIGRGAVIPAHARVIDRIMESRERPERPVIWVRPRQAATERLTR